MVASFYFCAMAGFWKCLPLLVVVFFAACSNSVSSWQGGESTEFVKVQSSGKFAVLGTDSPEASIRERPSLKAFFGYDFKIGRHEVTQGEFAALMGSRFSDVEDDSLPVVNVTYFDAILYANARSRSEGLDSSYAYDAAKFDAVGNCIGLENLVFLPEAVAYRLPTEAEWVYAASMGWNPHKSWNNVNSGYALHTVCSSPKNELGICDMAGNALEWVNDWLGYFPKVDVSNYAGASDGGKLAERVVKGGYFGSDPDNMHLYSRDDTYSILSSTKNRYVGFRLALGAIPNAEWTNNNGAVGSSRILPVFSASALKSLTRTYNAILAFRNDVSGNLSYIDYSNSNLSVFEFDDTLDVYHPDISPNGKYVAFCTKPEGVDGISSVYVRPLDASGNPAIRLDVKSAAIPRWRVLSNGDTVLVYVTNAGNNKDESEWLKESTWQVPFMQGAFGTPRELYKGTFHGGISKGNSLAVSGARLLRARIKEKSESRDTVWYNGEQACNVSLSKDGSNRTMFLDFGGKTGRKFVGVDYRTHERMLVVDSLGRLLQSVGAPKGFTFDHTEWTNSQGLAVATLANMDGAHGKIVLIDLRDSSVTDLVTGDELWHPCLWTNPLHLPDSAWSGLDLDSAGVYYTEAGGSDAAFMRVNMELLWQYKDSANTVVLGSSRSANAVDPLLFEKDIFAVNLSKVPNITYESKFMFENYVLPHVKKLKYIVLSLDIDMWWHSELNETDNFFASAYKNNPGYVYDENHDFWKDGYPEGLLECTRNSLSNALFQERFANHRGVQEVDYLAGDWEGDYPSVDYDSTWMDFQREEYLRNLQNIEDIVELAAKNSVKVVGVVFPQSPGYKNTGAFGRYGLRRSDAVEVLNDLNKLVQKYKNFKLLDENKMGDHDYSDAMAVNRDHLRNVAGTQMTSRIDSVLHSF